MRNGKTIVIKGFLYDDKWFSVFEFDHFLFLISGSNCNSTNYSGFGFNGKQSQSDYSLNSWSTSFSSVRLIQMYRESICIDFVAFFKLDSFLPDILKYNIECISNSVESIKCRKSERLRDIR